MTAVICFVNLMEWTDNYLGCWADGHGSELEIGRVAENLFKVTLLQNGQPILRPWCNQQPAVDMPASYVDDVMDGDEFAVDLWPPNKGFELILAFEPKYELDAQYRDSLTVCISRDEQHEFLDRHYGLLSLRHFTRVGDKTITDKPNTDRK